MQIVIDIPDRIYSIVQNKPLNIIDSGIVEKAIANGTPLPKGHGDLIDRNELKRTMEKDKRRALSFVDLTDFVWLAPTIIEADTEVEGMTREEKLQKAHQMFDNRNLLTELKWQREYFKRGYISNQEELFNLWIFDECIKALEQEPCNDAISRQAAIDAVHKEFDECLVWDENGEKTANEVEQIIEELPSVTPQPKMGEWLEKEVNSDKVIEEWQSAKCSVCDRYHTTPYMYYFSHYKYCPSCGSYNGGD